METNADSDRLPNSSKRNKNFVLADLLGNKSKFCPVHGILKETEDLIQNSAILKRILDRDSNKSRKDVSIAKNLVKRKKYPCSCILLVLEKLLNSETEQPKLEEWLFQQLDKIYTQPIRDKSSLNIWKIEKAQTRKISIIEPLSRFKTVCRQMQCANRIDKCFRKKIHPLAKEQTIQIGKKNRRVYPRTSLDFPLQDFKTRIKLHWPLSAEICTAKDKSERTNEDLFKIHRIAQTLEAFRRYDRCSQLELCRVIRLEIYNRRRIIYRKGQTSNCFYFIFVGSVVVTPEQDEKSFFINKEAFRLGRGASFGEIGLLFTPHLREATVVCREYTELLVIDQRDFSTPTQLWNILNDEFQQRLQLLRKLDIFKTWSAENLQQIGLSAHIEYIPDGFVVIHDSLLNDRLCFILQGKCTVIMEVEIIFENKRWWIRVVPPRGENIRVSDFFRSGSNLKIKYATIHEPELTIEPVVELERHSSVDGNESEKYSKSPLPESEIDIKEETISAELQNALKIETMKCSEGGENSKTELSVAGDKTKEMEGSRDESQLESETEENIFEEDEKEEETEQFEDNFFRIPISGEYIELKKLAFKSAFLKVHALEKGECFGLHTLLKRSEPRVALISNGSLTVQIPKGVFLRYSDDELLKAVDSLLYNYQSLNASWRMLKWKLHWKELKQKTVKFKKRRR